MKDKLLISLVITVVIIGLFFASRQDDNESAAEKKEEVVSKSSFSDADTLPGFKSRRDRTQPKVSPEDLVPPIEFDLPIVELKEGESFQDFTPEEVALIEEQQRQLQDFAVRSKADKFERKLAIIVSELQLDNSQEDALRAYFAEIQGRIVNGDFQAYGLQELALREGGLDDILQEILTAEQLVQYEGREERRLQERVQQIADTEMKHVDGLFSLSEAQRQQVHDVLREEALQENRPKQSASAVDEQVQFGHEIAERVRAEGPDANSLEILIQARLEQGRNGTLSKLEGILSPQQLAVYRESLQLRDSSMEDFQHSLEAFQKRGPQ